MNEPGYSEVMASRCPDAKKHTKGMPLGYREWHEWAEKKAKTHTQTQCPTCKYWVIWKKKPKAEAP